jgi:hypothetical protein
VDETVAHADGLRPGDRRQRCTRHVARPICGFADDLHEVSERELQFAVARERIQTDADSHVVRITRVLEHVG